MPLRLRVIPPAGLKPGDESTAIIRAVVGLGHIAQVAVLPAFRHAPSNSRLAAIVSDDPAKRRALGATPSSDGIR